jgi:preprotein translocase subunit SecD
MKKNILWKVVLSVAILAIFTYGIFFGSDPARSMQAIKEHGLLAGLQQNIKLGLDLKGGTHLILQVKVNDAVRAEANNTIERVKEDLRQANVAYGDISQPDPQNAPERISIKGVPPESSSDLRRIVGERVPDYDMTSGPENSWVLAMKPSVLSDLKNRAVTQAIETIRSRIDTLGVTEPTIQEHGLGEYQILVQLPGVDDPARVKEIMQSTAMLEIRQALDPAEYKSEQEALAAHQGVLPPNSVILSGLSQGGHGGEPVYYVVSRTLAVGGGDLRPNGARSERDENNRPQIGFSLTREGGRKFGNFTGAHINDYLAVVLDNRVRSVARIESQINDNGRITGNFTPEQAQDLALVLNSGSLPAGINYLEERTVGPSLGADSIREGVRAAIYGMLAVMIFMFVYYRGAGVNANLGLILNTIILLGFLGFTGATLTLPGIAGVILTVGMGVDSNVLIFERIREELRNGKTPPSAVEQGFGHAWLTIIDTHVTTIVSAIILFLFGTGPVRGFAVTLTFGLLANLFTAVFVSRAIFDSILNRHQRGEALSI